MTNTPEGVVPRRHTDETKRKIGDSRRGQRMPEDSVTKMTDRVRANPPRPMLGKKHSPEAIEKMQQVRRNRVVDPEKEAKRIEALRVAVTGKPKSPEHRDKIRAGVLNYISKGGNAMNNTTMQNTQGERQIAEKLTSLGINFQQQFLLDGHLHDFYLPDFNLIIEFDGAHHWDIAWFVSRENQVQALSNQRKRDERRDRLAREAGYRIVSIKGRNQPGDSYHGTFDEQMVERGFWDIYPSDYDYGSAFEGDLDVLAEHKHRVSKWGWGK